MFSRAPAVSDRIEAIRLSRRPLLSFRLKRRVSFLSSILAGMQKGMISYRIGFSECEHGHASNGQHARKALSSESYSTCQEQISDQFRLSPGTRSRGQISPIQEPLIS
ncbi:hypothetical protein UP09_12650 [Bradyrhizobium sp. LTSP885]|nr:hypothetical protein UP09_12650 [Bradyrhizobium sp. LTSP885]